MKQVINSEFVEKILDLSSQSKTYGWQLNVLSSIFSAIKPSKYLQVGSFEGRSLALFSLFASAFKINYPWQLTSIDSWQGGEEHKKSQINMSKIENSFDEITKLCKQIAF